jgi:hypothetical protein
MVGLVSTDFVSSETRHKTLEEIAAAFGDELVSLTERDVSAEANVFEEKAATGHFKDDTKHV